MDLAKGAAGVLAEHSLEHPPRLHLERRSEVGRGRTSVRAGSRGDGSGNLRAKLRPEARDDLLHALATVWQIVDSVYRVRELAQATPGMNQRDPVVRGFLAATTVAEEFRHYVQHLQRELANPDHRFPVWGSVSWVSATDENTTFTAVTGAVPPGTEINGGVYDRLERRWVSRVSLSIRGIVFNVDPMVEATVSCAITCSRPSPRCSPVFRRSTTSCPSRSPLR